MFFFLRKKEKQERVDLSKEIDKQIEAINAEKEQKAAELSDELRKLTELIQKEGVSGIWLNATGGRRRK